MSIIFPFTSCQNADRSTFNRHGETMQKSQENKKGDDGNETIPELQESEKGDNSNESDLIKLLKSQNRPAAEISGFIKLQNENDYLGSPIGLPVWVPGHYMYEVAGKRYDGPQTINGCWIWVLRRLLRHMILSGNYPQISPDAWYCLSDSQIREIAYNIAASNKYTVKAQQDARGTGPIEPPLFVLLLKHFGIPDELNRVYYDGRVPGMPQKYLFAPIDSGNHGFDTNSSTECQDGQVRVWFVN
jgi:hypothetical protein